MKYKIVKEQRGFDWMLVLYVSKRFLCFSVWEFAVCRMLGHPDENEEQAAEALISLAKIKFAPEKKKIKEGVL